MGRHITVETALRSHPKFKRLRRLSGLSERDTIGALTSFWLSVREVSPDGRLPSWESDDVDEAAGTTGICSHLVAVHFLEEHDSGFVCHDWMDHSGNQCKDAQRKKDERDRKSKENPASKDCPRTDPGASALEGKGRGWKGKVRNGEEEPNLLLDARAPSGGWDSRFDEWWNLYGKKVGRATCEVLWSKLNPKGEALFVAIMDGTRRFLEWDRVKRGFKLDPERFLKRRIWQDEGEPKTQDEWANWEKGGKR
jgi:hypothetical protein